MKMKKYADADSLLKDASREIQPVLRKIRATIKKAAPEATEGISYGMVAYKRHGPLVYFMPWKSHIGFYPGSSKVTALTKEIAPYRASKGTLKFSLDKPIPYKLITKIVRLRVKENNAKKKK